MNSEQELDEIMQEVHDILKQDDKDSLWKLYDFDLSYEEDIAVVQVFCPFWTLNMGSLFEARGYECDIICCPNNQIKLTYVRDNEVPMREREITHEM